MIQEIINFTENLIADIPDIMKWNQGLTSGLHVFIDINEEGNWINSSLKEGTDYEYYDGKSEIEGDLLSSSIQYQSFSRLIDNDMNKCLDTLKCEVGKVGKVGKDGKDGKDGKITKYPIKQIQSCSPFVIGFKYKTKDKDKDKDRFRVVENRVKVYMENAKKICILQKEGESESKKVFDELNKKADSFLGNISTIFEKIQELSFEVSKTTTSNPKTVYDLKKDEFIFIYLRTATEKEYEETYDNYLINKLFLDNQYNSTKAISTTTLGVPFYKTSFNAGKPFFKHVTSLLYEGLNTRIEAKDVKMLFNFTILLSNKVLPNPLPICIDKQELKKHEILKIIKENGRLSYSEILKKMFTTCPDTILQKYYLLNIQKGTGSIVDFDFVPLFRYKLEPPLIIVNVTQIEEKKDGVSEVFPNKKIENIFDFERIIVREIFNNALVRIDTNKQSYITNYFGEVDPKYVKGGCVMYQMIMKYRQAFYDYIYKSKLNAITLKMVDDMMYNSILSNIQTDKIEGSFGRNYTIKKKINIWFSLYDLINNNFKKEIMASKVSDLLSKMSSIAKGETTLETPEEFAFGAGQIVSYLMDRSVATNKTYAMLEPYLQKSKSNQLQDAIAQTITVYKHGINICKSKFECLAAQVLIDESDVDMKPLLKYFLAGCFCHCVIYEKKENSNN
ncbi:MAG: hypothetical protein RRX93_06635 [Bacteroidales bacterium]